MHDRILDFARRLLWAAARLSVAVLLLSGLLHPRLMGQSAGSPARMEDWEKGGRRQDGVRGGLRPAERLRPRADRQLHAGTGRCVCEHGRSVCSDETLRSSNTSGLRTSCRAARRWCCWRRCRSGVSAERFDIEAKSDNHAPTKDQMRLMMQALLAERFQAGGAYRDARDAGAGAGAGEAGKDGPADAAASCGRAAVLEYAPRSHPARMRRPRGRLRWREGFRRCAATF